MKVSEFFQKTTLTDRRTFSFLFLHQLIKKDCEIINIVARRIMMGTLVAEAKLSGPSALVYEEAVKRNDQERILSELADKKIEESVLNRVR